MIRDDDLYDLLVKPLQKDVHLACPFDCCHSGTVLDLPYIYKADASMSEMENGQGWHPRQGQDCRLPQQPSGLIQMITLSTSNRCITW